MTVYKLHSEPLQDQWLDAYGHLNEAYYLVPFSNATWKLQDEFQIGVSYFEETGCAIYTVETHLRYLRDVRAPAEMHIESMVLGADAKRFWFCHRMVVDGNLCATGEFMTLHFSTREGRTAPFPDNVLQALTDAVAADPPDWIRGQIGLR